MNIDYTCACAYLNGLMRLLNSAEISMPPEEFKANEAIKFYDTEYKRVLGLDFSTDDTKIPTLFDLKTEREILDLYEQIYNLVDPMLTEYSTEWRIGCYHATMALMKERGIRYPHPSVLGDTKNAHVVFLQENKNISEVSKLFLVHGSFLLYYIDYQCRINQPQIQPSDQV